MNEPISKMTVIDFARAAGLKAGDITHDTYLYVNDQGQPTAIQKFDRNSRPADEREAFGYVSSFAEGLAEIRAAVNA